jgi:hypothetical protein
VYARAVGLFKYRVALWGDASELVVKRHNEGLCYVVLGAKAPCLNSSGRAR